LDMSISKSESPTKFRKTFLKLFKEMFMNF
jgi:hypothetical protein